MANDTTAQRVELDEDIMEIDTRYGKQTAPRSNLLDFPNGIPGFDGLTAFTLFREPDAIHLYYLQSTEDPDIRLPVVTPEICKIDFRIELSDQECMDINYQPDDELIVLLVLSDDQDQPDAGIKANLMGPIVINATSQRGMQKLLNNIDGAVVIDAR